MNGKEIALSELKNGSLIDLFEKFSLNPKASAVEINGQIIDRENFADRRLSENDTVEIIRFVGGG
ncbi:MAG TPA: sulfur carrier protein ThiS [Leptospiraceae bacterium]|nr:sulfur carrier protein ThiS [Leptospiraceae bacterium]HNF25688.1 sulfur carrier protein ThiS [Leptospiraceae bacterium]HNH08422.1 sulfur carrier protein ThiS [Leptospiraceae bacterium]HNI25187.1 sulfur carrier protein ThiS [Leptospiraceae bacterium]HNO25157.1 sulfur carrier protein ThiS [Leptospiraceae bacterium]